MMKPTRQRLIGYAAFILLTTLAGGTIGYIDQTGFFAMLQVQTSSNPATQMTLHSQAMEPISQDEYRRRTSHGWWMGCATGATLGAFWLWRKARK